MDYIIVIAAIKTLFFIFMIFIQGHTVLSKNKEKTCYIYRVFHGLWQDKFADGGSILGSSQLSLRPKLPLKTMLDLKVVKINSKIIFSLC